MKIRKNIGLVVGVIGFGTVGFLFTDAVNSNTGIFNSSRDGEIIGELNGTEIGRAEFDARYQDINNLYEINNQTQIPVEQAFQFQNLAWNQLLDEKIMQSELEAAGIAVSEEEMRLLMFSNQPAAQVRNYYATLTQDPSGNFDPARFEQIVTQIESAGNGPDNAALRYLNTIREDVKRSRSLQKYLTLTQKAVWAPKWKAEQTLTRQNTIANFSFVRLAADDVTDAQLKVSDADIDAYIAANPKMFTKDKVAAINQVSIDIIPSKEDTATTLNWLEEKRAKLADPKSDSIFVNNFATTPQGRYMGRFVTKTEVTTPMADTIFNAAAGSIVGPYLENGRYILAKVKEKAMVADSAKFAYMIVMTDSVLPNKTKLVDSIEAALTGGANMKTLATKYSFNAAQDPTVGDTVWRSYTYAGDPVVNPEIFKEVFVTGSAGKFIRKDLKLGRNITVFIKIAELRPAKSAIKVMFLEKEIVPGNKTLDLAYNTASKLYTEVQAGKSLDDAAKAANVIARPIDNIRPDLANLAGFNTNVREIVRWALNNEVGTSTLFKEFVQAERKYVVAVITNSKPYGLPTAKTLSEQERTDVIRKKKLEFLLKKASDAANGATSIQAVATKLGVQVQQATDANLAGSFVPNVGNEPAVIGAAAGLAANKMSKAIEGQLAVFVIQSTNVIVNPVDMATNLPMAVSTVMNQGMSKFGYPVIESLRKAAEIKDERFKVF